MAQSAMQATPRSDAGAKVTVACKLPAGLVIRAHRKLTEREAVIGGGTREFDAYRWDGIRQAEINGTAAPFGQAPKCQIVAGFAITPNVPKDIWDAWYEHNKEQPYITKGLVLAYERSGDAEAEARTNEKAETGFESVDPDAPWKKVRGIAKADVK